MLSNSTKTVDVYGGSMLLNTSNALKNEANVESCCISAQQQHHQQQQQQHQQRPFYGSCIDKPVLDVITIKKIGESVGIKFCCPHALLMATEKMLSSKTLVATVYLMNTN